MTGELCFNIAKRLLSSFFPDSEMEIELNPGKEKLVTRSPGRISFKLNEDDSFRIVFRRKRNFTAEEEQIFNTFISFIQKKRSLEHDPYFMSILEILFPEFISSFISKEDTIISKVIEKYIQLSEMTYEGRKISLSCIVEVNKESSGFNYIELLENKSGPVLTNGLDTVFQIGKNGGIKDFVYCETVGSSKEEESNDPSVPFRYLQIANKTNENRIAIILNKNDELIIIKNKNLLFTRRRGKWQYYESNVLYQNITSGNNQPHSFLRKGVFLTALDISFSRSGGCIAIISDSKKELFDAMMLTKGANSQSFLGENVVQKFLKKKFYEIPRQLRAEICGIDGAVILDQKGYILYSGKIIPVEVTVESGARTAAAKTLAQFGIGIKVSMDGIAEAYISNGNEIEKIQTFC